MVKNEVIGFMNVDGNSVLGGAEFYPSLYVPYDIPKAEDIAFITCGYLSDEDYDYKSALLKALETVSYTHLFKVRWKDIGEHKNE